MQNFDHNIGFWEKRQFFRRKSQKIAENCDHNIDPWCCSGKFGSRKIGSRQKLHTFFTSSKHFDRLRLRNISGHSDVGSSVTEAASLSIWCYKNKKRDGTHSTHFYKYNFSTHFYKFNFSTHFYKFNFSTHFYKFNFDVHFYKFTYRYIFTSSIFGTFLQVPFWIHFYVFDSLDRLPTVSVQPSSRCYVLLSTSKMSLPHN
jgi:hypothetical protein